MKSIYRRPECSLRSLLIVFTLVYVVQSEPTRPSSPFSLMHVLKRAIATSNDAASSSGDGAYGLDYSGASDSYDPSINYLYSYNETYSFYNKLSPKFKPKHSKNRHHNPKSPQSSYSESDLINFSSGDHERSLSSLFNLNNHPYDSTYYESGNYDHTGLNDSATYLTQNFDFNLFFNKNRSSMNNVGTAPTTNENIDPLVATLITKIILCIFYIFICVSCVLGNILVILSVFTYKPLQSVQNIFIVSLAVADTLVAIFVMPFHIILHIKDGEWIFGGFICHFFISLDIMLCTASILHLCCIALDRYWAIKDSIKYAQKRTMKRVLFMILIVWISSAFISLPGIFWNTNTIGLFPITPAAKSEPSAPTASSTSPNNNATLALFRESFGITTTTTAASTSSIRPDSNMPYDKEKYHFVCDISRDISYRIYSSCGTFWVPLLIMTFVYVQIYLETKRRLHERAKAAKKLANSIAQHQNKTAVMPESSFIKKCASRYLLCCCLRKKTLLETQSICGEKSSNSRKQASPAEEGVIMLDNETGLLNSDSMADESRKSLSRVSKPIKNISSRTMIQSIDEEDSSPTNFAKKAYQGLPTESLSLNRSNGDSDLGDEMVDDKNVSPKSLKSSFESTNVDSASPKLLKSFHELKPRKKVLSVDDSLAVKYKHSLTPSLVNQHSAKLPSDDNISQDGQSSISCENENDSASLKLNGVNTNAHESKDLKGVIRKTDSVMPRKKVTMKALNILHTELLRGDDIKPANTEVKRVSIGTNTPTTPSGIKLRSQISADGTIASQTEPPSPGDLNRLNSTTLSIANPTSSLSPSTTQWLRTSANTGMTLKQRQKISLTRERRAARTLGIIMGSFTLCWCPFFIVYILQSFGFEFSDGLSTFLTWLGYVNSALNPVIYTVFNLDFRKSFKRLLFGCILCKRR